MALIIYTLITTDWNGDAEILNIYPDYYNAIQAADKALKDDPDLMTAEVLLESVEADGKHTKAQLYRASNPA